MHSCRYSNNLNFSAAISLEWFTIDVVTIEVLNLKIAEKELILLWTDGLEDSKLIGFDYLFLLKQNKTHYLFLQKSVDFYRFDIGFYSSL